MKHLIISIMCVLGLSACEKYDVIHTGKANGVHDCTMWEYFHTNHYDWDSVIVAIDHAGLTGLFDGPDSLTFFGMTNWSVKHFIMHTTDEDGNQKYRSIRDIPVEVCRRMILSHVVVGKRMKESFDYEVRNTNEGGTEVLSALGKPLRVFRTKGDYGDYTEKGAEGMGVHGKESGQIVPVASADIQVSNGVVHSLVYEYEWTEL